MSAHYLVDMFSSPVSTSPVSAVTYPTNGQTVLNGNFVVKVPDGVAIAPPPTNLSDLLTKKHQGLLAFYAGFAHIAYDDLLDATDIDLTNSVGVFGQRGIVTLPPASVGLLQTLPVTLTGSPPAYAVVTWDIWEATDSDPSTGRLVRTYNELPPTSTYATVQASFNGGSTYTTMTNGAPAFLLPADLGTSFILKITNVHSTKRIRVGGWSVMY